jgi:hypothetical protein
MYFGGTGKKPLIMMAVVAAAVLAGIFYMFSGSTQREPTEFRGIAWGASARNAANLKLVAEEGDLTLYERSSEQLTVGDARVQRIVYGFHRDRFYNVMVYFESATSFSRIKDALTKDFGAPFQPPEAEGKYFWTGDMVSLLLSFDKSTNTGRLVYFFKPLQLEAEMSG